QNKTGDRQIARPEPSGRSTLLLHRAHHRADDRRQYGAAAGTAYRITEQAAESAASSRVRAGRATKQASEDCAAAHAADRTSKYLRQLSHRSRFQRGPHRLAADNTRDHLHYDWKKRFHAQSLQESRPRTNRLAH